MSMKYVMEAYELLDSPTVSGKDVGVALIEVGVSPENIEVKKVQTSRGNTDFVKVWFFGTRGKKNGGSAPTLGVVGRLGGIGARPEEIGLVSDADGAISAVAFAMKLGHMIKIGDRLKGDVFVSTHICPNALIRPHAPVPFMDSPISMTIANTEEMAKELDAVISIDTTRGNRIINYCGFALSPTVKEGYILRVSEDLLSLMSYVTGKAPVVFALTTQDITPYGNGLHHLNSILQPCTATSAPVVGVALTTEISVPGCSTGVSSVVDIESVVRFVLEVAKAFGRGDASFYDPKEFDHIQKLYGSMKFLQTMGKMSAL
ncbi:MAG: hypothetical protein CSA35_05765 [Dethiosulfovibrio peptidovorans]|nr:MAG: hypothetical protein CSA35_05765 [Dethiosulfovibrio peptidovorans]